MLEEREPVLKLLFPPQHTHIGTIQFESMELTSEMDWERRGGSGGALLRDLGDSLI